MTFHNFENRNNDYITRKIGNRLSREVILTRISSVFSNFEDSEILTVSIRIVC